MKEHNNIFITPLLPALPTVALPYLSPKSWRRGLTGKPYWCLLPSVVDLRRKQKGGFFTTIHNKLRSDKMIINQTEEESLAVYHNKTQQFEKCCY